MPFPPGVPSDVEYYRQYRSFLLRRISGKPKSKERRYRQGLLLVARLQGFYYETDLYWTKLDHARKIVQGKYGVATGP
jgi:hypothetical protein